VEKPTIIGIIDIGKTNAKFAVVDVRSRTELAVHSMPNIGLDTGPFPHFDIESIWEFLKQSIRILNREHAIDAFSVTSHGASAALVDGDGHLTLPVLDYEYCGPDDLAVEYNKIRPDYSTSFSPRLPSGLNLGAQLFWQQKKFPHEFNATSWIISYPQYWSFLLTGIAATEITSIGCHTDLWDFRTNEYSSLVNKLDWRSKFPPMRKANEILGPVDSGLARKLGLKDDIPVYCGIHDSNASLLPHLLQQEAAFSVVSTGTWIIVCSPGGDLAKLDESRDCLANIDLFGNSVASARFMGGREFSLATKDEDVFPSAADIDHVLAENIMLYPSLEAGTGPFPDAKAWWSHGKETLSAEILYVVVSYYLALMTAECLGLTGAQGDVIVEGPFAGNKHYLAMLAAISNQPVRADSTNKTGTSIGAALLANLGAKTLASDNQKPVSIGPDNSSSYQEYIAKWRVDCSRRNLK
jgi:sugar (pentulose or hexulose) kinase